MEIIVLLLVAVVMGFIARYLGKDKKNPTTGARYNGFWWGFWLSFIGIIIVLLRVQNYPKFEGEN
jgi:uncharacterized membrane protein